MTTNVSIWLRAFRPPLQRAYPRLDEIDRELADLLNLADERETAPTPCADDDMGRSSR
jgi:hypothetical protein